MDELWVKNRQSLIKHHQGKVKWHRAQLSWHQDRLRELTTDSLLGKEFTAEAAHHALTGE